jgi:hypothetical protein
MCKLKKKQEITFFFKKEKVSPKENKNANLFSLVFCKNPPNCLEKRKI